MPESTFADCKSQKEEEEEAEVVATPTNTSISSLIRLIGAPYAQNESKSCSCFLLVVIAFDLRAARSNWQISNICLPSTIHHSVRHKLGRILTEQKLS